MWGNSPNEAYVGVSCQRKRYPFHLQIVDKESVRTVSRLGTVGMSALSNACDLVWLTSKWKHNGKRLLWTLIFFFNKRVFIVYTRHRRMQKSPAEWNRWQLESTIDDRVVDRATWGAWQFISEFMRERSFPAVGKNSPNEAVSCQGKSYTLLPTSIKIR